MAWAATVQLEYSASLKHTEVKVEFDPFEILGIEDRKDVLPGYTGTQDGTLGSSVEIVWCLDPG